MGESDDTTQKAVTIDGTVGRDVNIVRTINNGDNNENNSTIESSKGELDESIIHTKSSDKTEIINKFIGLHQSNFTRLHTTLPLLHITFYHSFETPTYVSSDQNTVLGNCLLIYSTQDKLEAEEEGATLFGKDHSTDNTHVELQMYSMAWDDKLKRYDVTLMDTHDTSLFTFHFDGIHDSVLNVHELPHTSDFTLGVEPENSLVGGGRLHKVTDQATLTLLHHHTNVHTYKDYVVDLKNELVPKTLHTLYYKLEHNGEDITNTIPLSYDDPSIMTFYGTGPVLLTDNNFQPLGPEHFVFYTSARFDFSINNNHPFKMSQNQFKESFIINDGYGNSLTAENIYKDSGNNFTTLGLKCQSFNVTSGTGKYLEATHACIYYDTTGDTTDWANGEKLSRKIIIFKVVPEVMSMYEHFIKGAHEGEHTNIDDQGDHDDHD